MIRDRNIAWARKRVFRGSQVWQCWIGSATVVASDAGASVKAEVAAVGVAGFKATATGDLAHDFHPVPSDLDREQPTYWRVWWLSDTAATTKTFTATFKYKTIGSGTAVAAADTALSTAIASDTTQGANKLQKTAWGILNANKLTDGTFISTSIQTIGTVATKTIWLLGYEYEYTPLKSSADYGRKNVEAPRRVS